MTGLKLPLVISTNRRCGECHRSRLSSSKIQWEVVSVALVHHFHTQTSAVEYVCPGVQNTTLTINNGLIEVEPVEVECHGADAEGGKPDSHDWPRSEEEMQASRIVKRCILEDQATEVTVSSDDVVGLFFLTELVAIVLRLGFGGLTNQRRSNE